MENDEDLVLFREFGSDIEANMVKSVLETNGVPCMLTNENMATIMPIGPVSVGAIRLMVFRRDLQLARDVMASNPIDE
ncbi:MAG: DUF2007 domain-containing protein [Muribaculaceae bacterium]|jgi:hypothetical protein|nr:DUF2007 domain-containing protein [Muribaculaceae bacterium]